MQTTTGVRSQRNGAAGKSMPLTRASVANIREEITAALHEIATRRHLHIALGTLRFAPSRATARIDLSVPGLLETEEKAAFLNATDHYKLDPSRVASNGMKLIGFRPKASRCPWVVERIDGKRSVIPHGDAKLFFAINPNSN